MASSDDQARFSFSNSQIQSEIPFFFSSIHLVLQAAAAGSWLDVWLA
jgi:hypothetical protein